MKREYPKFDEFNYWFTTTRSNICSVYKIYREENNISLKFIYCGEASPNEPIVSKSNCPKDENVEDIIRDWVKFQMRPEFTFYQYITKQNPDLGTYSDAYLTLLEAICLLRVNPNSQMLTWGEKFKNPDKYIDKFNQIKEWLESTDFFIAPASSHQHECFESGLLIHSLTVADNVVDLLKLDKFAMVDEVSAILCALTHDWCKINFYQKYLKNVKNEETGVWEQVAAYRYTDKPMIPFGHGEASLYMVQNCFKLSIDEALAIRWHMGRWNVAENEQNDFRTANVNYPMVHLIQFADQLSIVNY